MERGKSLNNTQKKNSKYYEDPWYLGKDSKYYEDPRYLGKEGEGGIIIHAYTGFRREKTRYLLLRLHAVLTIAEEDRRCEQK